MQIVGGPRFGSKASQSMIRVVSGVSDIFVRRKSATRLYLDFVLTDQSMFRLSPVKVDEQPEALEDEKPAEKEDPLLRSEDGTSYAAGRIGTQFG